MSWPTPGHPAPAQSRLGTSSAAGFLGLEVEALEARLGPPAFTRQDPPAEFRRYRVGGCALELILYPHPEKERPVVAHARYRRTVRDHEGGGECGRAGR